MRNPSTSSSTAAATTTTTTTNTTNKTPCCSKVGLKRGPWTPEEDQLLASYIKKEGEGRWRTLPKRAGLLRCGKSCRLRWMNYLRPSVKRGQIAPDEEDLILRLHRLLGNRWSLIAGRIPGRTDNEIKNYWNTHLSKKLISQGIDPRTHKPLDHSNANNPPDHQATKASSSKANRSSSSSKLNNNPSSSDMEDDNNATRSNKLTLINMESGYVENTSLDDEYHQRDGIMTGHGHGHINGYTSLLNCDDSAVGGLRSGNVHQGFSNEEDEDINYCTDDVFSSFLNSLINEDAFSSHNQLQQQQQQQPSGITALSVPCSDPLVSITASTFGLGASWESPIMSSSFNQNDHSKRVVNDHVE